MIEEKIEHIVEPHAASLSQSLRDIGYSLETSIADLVDNSLTANAKNIWIDFDIHTKKPYLSITDDGHAMSQKELIEAMRPGTLNPRAKRNKNDLGRFGLGLKTASFSQCKQLTVISRKNGKLSSAQWDLDIVEKQNKWVVHQLTASDIENLGNINNLSETGTCVIWKQMDRLLENKTGTISANDFYEKFDAVEKHLSLVFHRFLSGEFRQKKLNIFINDSKVSPFDPFCTSIKATQILREETIRIDGSEIKIQPYILPHHSKLTKTEYNFYRNRSSFLNNQGVYVYRNGRLMAWGDWFRLIPRSEATKLARVKIDFSNEIDDLWTIDIKKSRAYPPQPVKERLKKIIDRIASRSKKVHKQRGAKLFSFDSDPVWERFMENDNVHYKLNRDNPLIHSLMERFNDEESKAISKLFELAETTLPLEAIYSDYSTQPKSFEVNDSLTIEELRLNLEEYWLLISSTGDWSKQQVFEHVLNIKPFCTQKEQTKILIKEILENE